MAEISDNSFASYRAAVILEAYKDAGYIDEEKAEASWPQLADSIANLAEAANGPELEFIMPLWQVKRKMGLRALIADPKLRRPTDGWHDPNGTWVFGSLWTQYSASELHDGDQQIGMARAMIKPDGFTDGLVPGLADLDSAISLLDNGARQRQQLLGRFLNPAGFLAINTVRRFEGVPLLSGFTTFPGLAAKPVHVTLGPVTPNQHKPSTGFVHHQPYATDNGIALTLGMSRSESNSKNPDSGFRFSVGLSNDS